MALWLPGSDCAQLLPCSVQAPVLGLADRTFGSKFCSAEANKKPQPLAGTVCLAPGVGLEPTTSKLTASCSTIELPGNT